MIAAVIPAAGLSVRMGRPKLVLPVGGVLLIARVVAAFREGGAGRVIVVTAPTEIPGASEIAGAATAEGAEVIVAPSPPADMRASVELGLEALARGAKPSALLLAPGDSPGLNPELVSRVIRNGRESSGRIVVPRHGGRSGHPVLLPWTLAKEIPRLPAGVGVNALLAAHPDLIAPFDADDPGILADLDTPEDYRAWSGPA
jgi:molybdenum cofactor cytidylyltransferase